MSCEVCPDVDRCMRYVAEQIRALPTEDETVKQKILTNMAANEQRQLELDSELANAETAEDMLAIAEIAGLHEQATQLANTTLRHEYQAVNIARIVTEDRFQRSLEEDLCPGDRAQ